MNGFKMASKVSTVLKKIPQRQRPIKTIISTTIKATANGFKFDWKPDKKKVKVVDMPHDALAPKPDHLRFVPLADRSPDLYTRRKKYIDKKLAEFADKNQDNKTAIADMPTVIKVKLKDLEIITDVQRPLDEDHVINIIIQWDSRNFRTPKGSIDPIRGKIGITDGQHRVIAFRERIKMGLFPEIDPEDWEEQEILVEVTTLDQHKNVTDYSPCREQFLGENGGYTKPVTEFDKLVNEVAAKLVDSPNKKTKPSYERAAKRYLILKKRGVTCVHTKDASNRVKPGAFTGVRYLRDDSLTDEEVDKIAKHHNDFWRHEPMSDIEILPIAKLLRELEGSRYYDEKNKTKVKEKDQFLLNCNAVVAEIAGDWDNFQSIAQETWQKMCKDVRQTEDKIPDDLSLTLLLQLAKKAGATHPSIKNHWYKKYIYNNTSLFDCLSDQKKALF